MKRISTMLLFAVLATAAGAADKASFESYTAKIVELLPPKWEVKGVTSNAVPYNLDIKPSQRQGTCIELVGPTVVKGPMGINDENESFQIWLMPADYTPTTPDKLAQFEAAKLLGSNETVAVYCTSFTTGTPSWKTWKEDIAKHFRLTKSPIKRSSELPPAGAAGSRSP
jgi:hypothetical protein